MLPLLHPRVPPSPAPSHFHPRFQIPFEHFPLFKNVNDNLIITFKIPLFTMLSFMIPKNLSFFLRSSIFFPISNYSKSPHLLPFFLFFYPFSTLCGKRKIPPDLHKMPVYHGPATRNSIKIWRLFTFLKYYILPVFQSSQEEKSEDSIEKCTKNDRNVQDFSNFCDSEFSEFNS